MDVTRLHDFYTVELLPALKSFDGKRRWLFPLVFVQGLLSIAVFTIIVANVFNGFSDAGGTATFQYASGAFLLLFFVMLGYATIRSFRLYLPRLFHNRRSVLLVSIVLGLILLYAVRLLKESPLVFISINLNNPVEFDGFFRMFGKFLLLFAFTFFVLVPLSILKKRLNDRLMADFRPEAIRQLAKFIIPGVRYNPVAGMSAQEITACGLFYNLPGMSFSSHDLATWDDSGLPMKFSHVEIFSTKEAGVTSEQHEIFTGMLLRSDFNKKIKGTTFVTTDYAENILGRLGRGLQRFSPDGTQLVQMEEPEFERYFVIRSSDPTEARYLLTPSLLEKILTGAKNLNHELEFSFSDNNLWVTIRLDRDWLAPSYIGNILSFRQVKDYCECLQLLGNISKELQLNNRIWG